MMTRTESIAISKGGSRYLRHMITMGIFFFIFGFITWINGTLIPYLKIACQLQEWEVYAVTFSFYIAYTIMALPSGKFLSRTGMIGGMRWGLIIMAFGCLFFIPAALMREYLLFLIALFIVGSGLTLLQTAVNPYITLLGSETSAAQRISIMGICNKFAGILAPIVFGAIILGDANGLLHELERLNGIELKLRLDNLAHGVILPYSIMAGILLALGLLVPSSRLPEISASFPVKEIGITAYLSNTAFKMRVAAGFTATFCTVGAEVIAGDTIGNYAIYQGMPLDVAKILTSHTLAFMMIGYLVGVSFIPRYFSQKKAFIISNFLGLSILICILVLPGKISVHFVSLLGFANALLWPAIWPQTLRNLQGKQLHIASAILVMGIAGGAVIPLIYGYLAGVFNNQLAYLILLPLYLYNLKFSASERSAPK